MGSALRVFLSIFFCAAFLGTISSCVLPPSVEGSRIFPWDELKYIRYRQQARAYALGGRFDMSELSLRKAMEMVGPDPDASLLSDLGSVLRAQNRLIEARGFLERALAKDEHALQVRANLARVIYDLGDTDEALRQFERVYQEYFDYWDSKPDWRLSQNFDTGDIVSVYRNLAILYSEVGLYAEAMCYSQRAADEGLDGYNDASHSKFLIAIDEFDNARDTLKAQINSTAQKLKAPMLSLLGKQTDPLPAPDSPAGQAMAAAAAAKSATLEATQSPKLLDLGLVFLIGKNYPMADEALDRVLSETVVPADQRISATLLRYLSAKQENDLDEMNLIALTADDSTTSICSVDRFVAPSYWPLSLKQQTEAEHKHLCED